MDNINDIISSLSDEDIEMLKGVASSILSDSPKKNEVGNNRAVSDSNMSENIPSLGGLNLNADDLNMILKAKSVFDKMNGASSKNADLINALKPHLSPQSRKKADEAIRILKLFDALPYIKELF